MRYRVKASKLNMREGPSTLSPIKQVLPNGHEVDSIADGWVRVKSAEYGEGWVFAEHLEAVHGEPEWLRIARTEIGVTEVPGKDANPRIVEYHSVTSLSATSDEVAWCASFVGWALKQAGQTGTGSAAARSYLKWGQELKEPKVGAVAVFKRGAPPSGHVGFYLRHETGRIRILGGNQSNRVSEMWMPWSDLLGYRWPNEPPALRVAA